ncbi:MAG TPA: amidohydrolase family protein, partial [Candidatus Binatia bacterium]|nr:amidohydrolase family protein [Candidatus Binatia bacterium]
WELEQLVAAGLTPWEALETATVNPARFLGEEEHGGSVGEGRRADLVLLDADPLADIRNTARIAAVIVGGRLIERPELDAMVGTACPFAR